MREFKTVGSYVYASPTTDRAMYFLTLMPIGQILFNHR
jgi:hypothetical protein